SVEELARRWIEHAGQAAFYVENGLMPGLLGLAFWDIIFLPVRGAFFNPFQRGPSDLFTPDFRKQRQALIDARFEALADIDFFYTRVMQTFAAKSPIANYFVNWGILDEKLLRTVFERIPAADLLKIFQRLLRDPGHNCSGLPDLIVFPTEPGYRLVEVKGPGDALQNNQKRWLAFFKQQHIPAEVAYVKWQS
ncbi:MAG: VRR-NUC domain-containing protein, partial [Pseudomonadales bacterium]